MAQVAAHEGAPFAPPVGRGLEGLTVVASTVPSAVTARPSATRRLVSHVRDPLHRNGYALVASTFATSGLGAAYWAIAAHRYSAAQVGINASLISTMMFLTNLASLNFSDVLNRFVPVGGKRSSRLVLTSYAIALALGGVSATVFVLGLGIWSPWLRDTLHGPGLGVLYIAATMFWVVFVLQDAVLIGLRKATYVLVENVAFGIVKIVLLVVLASALPKDGIFISWTLPLLAVVVAVNAVIFRGLMPRHVADESGAVEDVDRRDVGKFLVADYVAAMAWTATIGLMPVLVLNMNGADASAYVYLTWTIAYTLYLVSRNMGMALTAEGARDPAHLHDHARAVLRSASRIIVPGALLLAAGAPLVLRVFGGGYASHGTALLRLLALSTIPAIVPSTFVSVARVQRRLAAMVVVTVLSTLPVLALAPLFLHWFGIAGVGVSWLLVQSAVAVVVLPMVLNVHAPTRAVHEPAPVPATAS
jgi:O-antigen/teichoic acid export membrane protein